MHDDGSNRMGTTQGRTHRLSRLTLLVHLSQKLTYSLHCHLTLFIEWVSDASKHHITQWCGPLEYNNGMLETHFVNKSPYATSWATNCYILRACRVIVEHIVMLWIRGGEILLYFFSFLCFSFFLFFSRFLLVLIKWQFFIDRMRVTIHNSRLA